MRKKCHYSLGRRKIQRCNIPIDNDTGRARPFVMVDNQDDRLVEDTAEFFIGNQDATRFNVVNGMCPPVFANGRSRWRLEVDGKFVRRNERVIKVVRYQDTPSNGVAAVNIVITIVIVSFGPVLVAIVLENGRNGSAKEFSELSLLFQFVIRRRGRRRGR